MGNGEELGKQPENKDAVLYFPTSSSLFKVGQFYQSTEDSLVTQGIPHLAKTLQSRGSVPCNWSEWSTKGVECQFLRPGSPGWRKGKLKIEISLKFYPDEPDEAELSLNGTSNSAESPLDSIRQMTVE